MQSLILPATFNSLERISAFVKDATAQAGLDDHAAWQVELAVDEAATNIVQHAHTPDAREELEISWRIENDALVVALRDWGKPFDPTSVPAPDIHSPFEERQAGGLGIFLMNRLMDSVDFQFETENGNLLTMVKHIQQASLPVQLFTLHGRLDAISTNHELEVVRSAISGGGRRVLLDMSGVTFMSSSGLRALLLLRRELLAVQGELYLCAMQPQVQEVFELTGFTQVFTIHTTRQEAQAAFGQAPA